MPETFTQSVGGRSMTGERSAFQAGNSARGVAGATYAFEVALAEQVEGIHLSGARGEIEQFYRLFVIAGAATAPQQALGLP